ncbi:MAG: 3-oxoacyl-[acyl-carrier protein] reductase [Saprospiraceae bacterium]|jgi:3-oxoacyl-[acyl-carrier protein] reductase
MLKDKVAIITGGSKGIGYGIAAACLAEGMKVAITSRSQEAADKAAQALSTDSDRVIGIASDVRNYEDEKKVVQTVLDKWGKVDAMIANAGVGHFAPIQEMTHQQWNEVMDINLTGVFNSTKASLDALIASKGYLITIASLAGTNFFPTGAAYNASKFGLVGFTQAVMMDVRQEGVKVTTIMPGSVATHFNDHQPSDADAWKIQPEDIGKLCVDLLTMPPRSLPSKIEIRPSAPPKK